MKQYASFTTTDLLYGSELRGPDWPDSQHGTLEQHVRNGWSVISSAIRPGICGHESTTYLFLLEREAEQPHQASGTEP